LELLDPPELSDPKDPKELKVFLDLQEELDLKV
jgi:hypothetical protein